MNKKKLCAIIVAVAVVLAIIVGIIIAIFNNKSHGNKGHYTESQISDIAQWWQSGASVNQDGDISMSDNDSQ